MLLWIFYYINNTYMCTTILIDDSNETVNGQVSNRKK